MRIDLETIPPEGLSIKEEEPAGILVVEDKDVEFSVPVKVSIFVNLVSGTLLVEGKLETEAELFCSRCLKKYKQQLASNDFSFDLDVRGKTEVDITENIREGIILQLPVKPLCKPRCRGVCHKCGQDLNEKNCSCDKGPKNIKWQELDKIKLKKAKG